MRPRLLLSVILFLSSLQGVYATTDDLEENFLVVNPRTNQIILQLGSHVHQRVSPCSTFKITLALIGFDSGILQDQNAPNWSFEEGYVAYKESWKAPQTPLSWMQTSCIWYSQRLAAQLGLGTLKTYLSSMEYGNQDMSGGLTNAWLDSSLKISPAEQVSFIQRMIQQDICIRPTAIELT